MLIIGIAGGTGSGKTTVVSNILKELGEQDVTVLSQDSYYKDNAEKSFAERELINYDHPNSIDYELFIEHLTQLKNGETINQPVYSYSQHTRTDQVLITQPSKVLIVEGILVFTNRDLLSLFDIKIFVHADSDERLIRRIKRDVAERGRDVNEVLNRYQKTLKPMHNQFIEPTKAYADLIIPNMTKNNVAVNVIQSVIKEQFVKK